MHDARTRQPYKSKYLLKMYFLITNGYGFKLKKNLFKIGSIKINLKNNILSFFTKTNFIVVLLVWEKKLYSKNLKLT